MLKCSIPFVDLRDKTPVDLLRAYPDKAHTLLRAACSTYGIWSRMARKVTLPVTDRNSHAWLKRTRNPYLYEIESFGDIIDAAGIYTFNLVLEWGCTSGVYRDEDHVPFLRVLDWPIPELGKHVMVVHQKGKAGDFHNVTWPGLSGIFTAMATGRFAAGLNQAPARMHGLGVAGDWVKNRIIAKHQTGLPPAHLLRKVFEQAESYEAAREMLTKTPIATPVIYTLSGIRAGQGSVIERAENAAKVTDIAATQQVSAANHFSTYELVPGAKGWRTRTEDSAGRLRQSATILGYDLSRPNFTWLQGPIINSLTRLCVVADAASGRLLVQGYEGIVQATELFTLPGTN